MIRNQLNDKFPFISCIKSNDIEYVGIIVNYDNLVISIYDLSVITETKNRQFFLEMGEAWWWESNRKIPINIFLKKEMHPFKSYIKTFNSKDIEIVFGPTVSLSEIAEKRVKRKSVQLIRSTKSIRN